MVSAAQGKRWKFSGPSPLLVRCLQILEFWGPTATLVASVTLVADCYKEYHCARVALWPFFTFQYHRKILPGLSKQKQNNLGKEILKWEIFCWYFKVNYTRVIFFLDRNLFCGTLEIWNRVTLGYWDSTMRILCSTLPLLWTLALVVKCKKRSLEW